jgi:large repetitive protein
VAARSFSTPRDQALAVAAPGVLANATDADGDNMTVVWHSQPAYGNLSVAFNGSFVYVPFDFVGPSSRADSFAFNASDGQGGFAQGVVSLTVGERADQGGASGGCKGVQVQGRL